MLLQERDEHAPIDPERWGMVGGHVEDGEEHEPAAYRELEEETGVRLEPGTLLRWQAGEADVLVGRGGATYEIYVARVELTDADIVLGEGRQIVFVDPDRMPDLDLAPLARRVVAEFLGSAQYAALRG